MRQEAVLDTGAASSFIHADSLPAGVRVKALSSAVNVRGANSQRLVIRGTVDLMVQVGSCKSHMTFYVAPSLAATLILGCDFCDLHVESIQPRRRVVELDDGSMTRILSGQATKGLGAAILGESGDKTE